MRRPSPLTCALSVLLLLASALPAAAEGWRVNSAKSRLAFVYTEDGKPEDGGFGKFSGKGDFDPSRPQNAKLDLTIDVRSIRLKDSLRSDLVKTETWFDAFNIPNARFQLKKLTPMKKAGVYRADGVLTIKKRSRRVRPIVTLNVDSRTARARGRVSFKRSDFRIGDPTISLFVEVGDKITVDFDLRAERL